ncbi:MAG TPA: hypothetical protein VFU81_18570 [Thermomicrobiales bacterium]|nr:hypothetical protein [Thermomicrobiales bacterium]
MIDVSTAGDPQRRDRALRMPAVGCDAAIAAALACGGTRIPLPAVPFLPVEPLRASSSARRDGAEQSLAPTSFGVA